MGLQKAAQVKVKGVADIVFCFDCTGSMTEIINSVKENVGKLIEGFATNEVSLNWRARCLGYRDFEVAGVISQIYKNESVSRVVKQTDLPINR